MATPLENQTGIDQQNGRERSDVDQSRRVETSSHNAAPSAISIVNKTVASNRNDGAVLRWPMRSNSPRLIRERLEKMIVSSPGEFTLQIEVDDAFGRDPKLIELLTQLLGQSRPNGSRLMLRTNNASLKQTLLGHLQTLPTTMQPRTQWDVLESPNGQPTSTNPNSIDPFRDSDADETSEDQSDEADNMPVTESAARQALRKRFEPAALPASIAEQLDDIELDIAEDPAADTGRSAGLPKKRLLTLISIGVAAGLVVIAVESWLILNQVHSQPGKSMVVKSFERSNPNATNAMITSLRQQLESVESERDQWRMRYEGLQRKLDRFKSSLSNMEN
ncbi:MAG: hypothetical protein AAF745_16080 [Planctomycetota bacterium]